MSALLFKSRFDSTRDLVTVLTEHYTVSVFHSLIKITRNNGEQAPEYIASLTTHLLQPTRNNAIILTRVVFVLCFNEESKSTPGENIEYRMSSISKKQKLRSLENNRHTRVR